MHVFSLALPAAPVKLSTQRVADADISALCFDGSGSSGSSTLAVGCKRGTVRLVRFQHDGSCSTLAAALTDHKSAVTGLALGAARGQAWLCSSGADGRRFTYSWAAPPAGAQTVQPQLTGQAAAPRCSWVGLAPAGGDAVVAASKAGRVVCASPAEAGAETSLGSLLSRNQGEWWVPDCCAAVSAAQLPAHMLHAPEADAPPCAPFTPTAGELSCFAVDASLSLLACATSRNSLLLFSFSQGGAKPAPLAAVKAAHTAGSAITKVGLLCWPESRRCRVQGLRSLCMHAAAVRGRFN